MNKAIFLDRDGTINVDTSYTHKIKDFQFEEGAIEGLKILQTLNYRLIITTGQSGIGRGKYTEEQYHLFMDHLYGELEKHRIRIDGEYFCPHHPEKAIGEYKIDCNCRKPKIGMLEQAVKDFYTNVFKDEFLQRSWVIGDKTDDIQMGKNAKCKTILVKTGKAGQDKHFDVVPDYTVENLFEAAKIIKNY